MVHFKKIIRPNLTANNATEISVYAIGWYSYLPPANEVWGKVIFLHLFVILFTGGACVVARGAWFYSGGHAWFYSGGPCVVLFGGACVVLFGGCAWFYLGGMCGFIWGACVVLFGGACVVLFGGACVVLFGGCVVLFGGHAWFYSGGACVVFSVFSDTMRYGQ